MSRKLPAWLTRRADGVFVVDPDLAYPRILTLLGVQEADYDQFWIETAYQCAKQAVQELILDTELDPRPRDGGKGMALVIVIESGGGRKGRWALANFKPGKGPQAASGVRNLVDPSQAKRAYWRIARALLDA